MVRWQPDARQRLLDAARELFGERGYDETTVAQIASAAGLTERTFFRYFADKREVLFDGSAHFEQTVVDAMHAQPRETGPMAAVGAGLLAAAALVDGRGTFARERASVLAANPELQEREQAKMVALGASMSAELRARGVREPSASLAAEAGVGVLRVAYGRWAAGSPRTRLVTVMVRCLDQLRAVAAG